MAQHLDPPSPGMWIWCVLLSMLADFSFVGRLSNEANATGVLSNELLLTIPRGKTTFVKRTNCAREFRREQARRTQPKQRIAKPHVEGFA